jgi:hypothetical protein
MAEIFNSGYGLFITLGVLAIVGVILYFIFDRAMQ